MNGHRGGTAGNRRLKILVVLVVMFAALTIALVHIVRDMERERFFQTTRSTEATTQTSGNEEDLYADDTGRMTYYKGEWYQKRNGLETILVIGLDKSAEYVEQESSYRSTQQADFLLLLMFDRRNGDLSVLHINRDTMTDIWQLDVLGRAVDTFKGQLALSHTYGATEAERCQYTVRAVSKFLYGMNIDHYISFTMDAVPILNDLSGGVTLTLMDDFSGQYEGYTEGAEVTLKGEQALSYVRARGELEDSTNLHRMERQRQYLNALTQVMKEKAEKDGGFTQKALSNVEEYLYSDCTILQLSRYAQYALEEDYAGIEAVSGEAVRGEQFMEFYANDEDLQEQIIRFFYEPAQ